MISLRKKIVRMFGHRRDGVTTFFIQYNTGDVVRYVIDGEEKKDFFEI